MRGLVPIVSQTFFKPIECGSATCDIGEALCRLLRPRLSIESKKKLPGMAIDQTILWPISSRLPNT